jgi:hypothetical protein
MREVPGGVQYVVWNESCLLTGFLAGANRRPLAKVGDRIQYATDDKYLYLKDTTSAIHKLRYMLQELMPPPPPPPIRLLVAEAVNDAPKYSNRLVTIVGFLNVSDEFTAISGSGCAERMNMLRKPYSCAVSLRMPDCTRQETRCTPNLIELSNRMRQIFSTERVQIAVTGTLQLPPKVFVEYSHPPVVPGLPKGEDVEMGFGHLNGFLLQLTVTDGRLLP